MLHELIELATKNMRHGCVQRKEFYLFTLLLAGIIADTILVSSLMHKYGGLVFWDYATAGPYLDIDMHPLSDRLADKDAVFLSMHKFVGGVDAPGMCGGDQTFLLVSTLILTSRFLPRSRRPHRETVIVQEPDPVKLRGRVGLFCH